MSLIEKILREISETTISYKGMRVNLLGLPSFKPYSPTSIKSTLTRLRKNGLVENDADTGWHLTSAGKKYMKKKEDSLVQFEHIFKKDAPKNLIVMFDIPETKKAEREWFRWHLKKFNYEMIQKSVWVGPSPLPKQFTDYLNKIDLRDNLKTFKLAKNYADIKTK